MNVEIGGGAKALDEGDGTRVGFAAFESRLLDQKAGNHAVDDLQLRMSGKEDAQRNREREYPLAHRHPRDEVIDQVGGGLCHAPRATRGAKVAPFAGEGDQLLVAAVPTEQPQKSVRENTAFEKGIG